MSDAPLHLYLPTYLPMYQLHVVARPKNRKKVSKMLKPAVPPLHTVVDMVCILLSGCVDGGDRYADMHMHVLLLLGILDLPPAQKMLKPAAPPLYYGDGVNSPVWLC